MRARLRRWRRIGALAGSLLLCLIPHLLWLLIRRPSPWPRRFLAMAARSVGARPTIVGAPLPADVFFVANHLSWIDILALGGTTGTAFVARDGIAAWPVIGWLAAQNRTIFVARDRRGTLGDQLESLRAAMAGHQPVTLFPEGTTNDGTVLLPFKPALLAVMIPPPRPVLIQPVHIDYGAATTDIAWFGDEPAGVNAIRILGRAGTLPVMLRFLEPFDPVALGDRKAVAAEAQKRIAASLALHAPPSASPPGAL